MVLYKLLGARVRHGNFSGDVISRKLYLVQENEKFIRYFTINTCCRKTVIG